MICQSTWFCDRSASVRSQKSSACRRAFATLFSPDMSRWASMPLIVQASWENVSHRTIS